MSSSYSIPIQGEEESASSSTVWLIDISASLEATVLFFGRAIGARINTSLGCLSICGVHLAPNCTIELKTAVSRVCDDFYKHVDESHGLLLGDFNFRTTGDFSFNRFTKDSRRKKGPICSMFGIFMRCAELHQDDSTWARRGAHSRIDRIYTNTRTADILDLKPEAYLQQDRTHFFAPSSDRAHILQRDWRQRENEVEETERQLGSRVQRSGTLNYLLTTFSKLGVSAKTPTLPLPKSNMQ
jgi:hypothetical protein